MGTKSHSPSARFGAPHFYARRAGSHDAMLKSAPCDTWRGGTHPDHFAGFAAQGIASDIEPAVVTLFLAGLTRASLRSNTYLELLRPHGTMAFLTLTPRP